MRALLIVCTLTTLIGLTIWSQAPDELSRNTPEYQAPDELSRNTPEYQTAYKHGRAEAERELRDEAATIFTCGTRNLFENLDKETGLPSSGLGCVVNHGVSGRVTGHNERIEEHIRAHGLPKNSFKPWERELFGLEDYYDARKKLDNPESLKASGAILKSPDGSYTLKPIVNQDTIDGKVVKRLEVEISGPQRKPEAIWLFANADESVEVFWGPKGSGFAVVANNGSGHDMFIAVDLRRGTWLRIEMASGAERPEATAKSSRHPD